MLYRIPVDVIQMPIEILIIPDQVLPKAPVMVFPGSLSDIRAYGLLNCVEHPEPLRCRTLGMADTSRSSLRRGSSVN